VAEGAPMAALLRAAVDAQIAPDYAAHLLTFMDEAAPVPPVTAPAAQDLVEPLSDRELDVLRLLATDLTGPEIADELVVSLNTMRTHTKNIYGKLGVNKRALAIARARELQLI
ncbi:MAG: response regulator transcription factor, partial [Caldilineaceae bacterium]|nr:response regulator transcription factor [Caldilineaceae bacterium]